MGIITSKPKNNKYGGEDLFKPKGIYSSNLRGTKKESHLEDQDVYHMIGFESEGTKIRFFGIYDGHGDKGNLAANLVCKEMTSFVLNSKSLFKKWNNKDTISKKFSDLNRDIQKKMSKDFESYEQSGSCGICVLIIDKLLFCINIGDSRCVIGSKSDKVYAAQLSLDHKPNDPDEKARIIKAGGEVTNNKDGTFGPYRVYKSSSDNLPGLAVSRSFGDLAGHDVGVSELPQVSFKVIDQADEFVVIGSDGVFDVMSSMEIVGYVFERIDQVGAEKIASEITAECRKRWVVIHKHRTDRFIEKIREETELQIKKNEEDGEGNRNFSLKSNMNQNIQRLEDRKEANSLQNIDDITCVICFLKQI